ncbi:MAG: autotransporter-associated beta strand repeat-containing protein [Kiritimatiellae bacterium]|nr:autotransporter-associated beta strand repeat-containing protein [Kiritimatiellia bacterium]
MKTSVIMVMGMILLAPVGYTAERTWDGAGSDVQWSLADNWGGFALLPGDALFFGGTAGLVNSNDLLEGTSFAGITFNSGAGAFVLGGNAITLDGDVVNNDADAQRIDLAMLLSNIRTFNASNGTLTLSGTLSGPGGLTATGGKALTLSGSNTYEGVTTLTPNGRIFVNHAHALGSTNANTVIEDGGWIEVRGGIDVGEPLVMRGDVSTSYSGVLRSMGGDNVWSGPISTPIGNSRISTFNSSPILIKGGITGNGIVLAANSGDITISSQPMVFTSSATVHAHAGSLKILAVSNNLWGELEVAGGEVRTDVANALPPESKLKLGVSYSLSGTFNLNGYDQTVGQLYSGYLTNAGSRIVTSPSPATLTVNQSANTTYDGRLMGKLTLVKTNTGTLALTGINNTQSGRIIVNGGKLSLSDERSLGAVPATFSADALTLNGSTLLSSATWTLDDATRGVTLGAANGSVEVIAPAEVKLATPITGPGGLTKAGSGILTLSGANDYTGLTIVNAGILQVGQKASLYNGAPLTAELFKVASGATLALQLGGPGEFEASDVVAIAALGSGTTGFKPGSRFGLAVVNAPGGRYEIPDALGDVIEGTPLILQKLGAGTLALTGANTYTGVTIIADGVLEANVIANGGEPSSLGAASRDAANIVFDGGTLRYTGPSVATDRSFTYGTGKTAIFDVANPAASLTFKRIGFCAGRNDNTLIVKNGPGTLVFGKDDIPGGDAYIGMVAGFVINEGTYLNVSGDAAQLNTIRPSSQGPAVTLGDGVYMGVGAALSRSANNDEQTVRYIGTNLMATTHIGSLQGPTTPGQWNTKIIDVNDGASDIDLLVLNSFGIYPDTAAPAISRIRKEGAGTLKLLGNASRYRETTIVRAGRVLVSANVPKGGNSVFGNCTADVVIGDTGTQPDDTPTILFDGPVNSAFTFSRGLSTWTTKGVSAFGSLSNVNVTLSGAVTVSNTLQLISVTAGTNALFITGGISGPGNVRKGGSGTTIFVAVNTYTGVTDVAEGTLRLAAAERIANTSKLRLSGGTFDPAGFDQSMGPLDVDANATLDFGAGCTLTFADSASQIWEGTLQLRNWKRGASHLFIGESATLSETQLAKITSPSGQTAAQLPDGEVILLPFGTMIFVR